MNRCAEFLMPAAFKVGSQRQEDNGRQERAGGKERKAAGGFALSLSFPVFPGLFH